MKPRILLVILLGMAFSAAAQQPAKDLSAVYAYPATQPDVDLTRQAFRLGQRFDAVAWETLAGALQSKPRPIRSYLGFYSNHSLQSSLLLLATLLPEGATAEQIAFVRTLPPDAGGLRHRLYGSGFGLDFLGQSVSKYAINQLYTRLGKLAYARRQSDYERLSDILLRRATKVRKIEESVPVLQFLVDSTGQVQDVTVDSRHTKVGLTARSKKIILAALRDERFRALEARKEFTKPRPMAEKVHQLSSRFSYRLHRLVRNVHFGKKLPLDRCGPHTQREARRERRYMLRLLYPKP